MLQVPVLLALLAAPLAFATPLARGNVGFYDPTANGGSWLDDAGTGVGEPMNVSNPEAHEIYTLI